MTQRTKPPFRADHVGSLLRSAALKEARAKREKGEITPQHLQEQLRTKVASFAVPSRWQLQTEPLPLNHAGKVDKAALVARVCRDLADKDGQATP